MPPYVVTGVATGADDPRAADARHELELTMTAVLGAVNSFNAHASSSIRVVGFSAEMLGIDRMDPAEAANIIVSVYEERFGQ